MEKKITPINRNVHNSMGWNRVQNYKFAESESFVPLVGSELSRAAIAMPISIMKYEDGYSFIALMGLAPGRNVFVTDDGRWVGAYVPSHFRSYPFSLPKAQDGRRVLCIDSNSGLIANVSEADESFFKKNGELAEKLEKIISFLKEIESNREKTLSACKTLDELGIIEEWPITLNSPSGPKVVDGLYRINESAMNALSDEDYTRLRRSGAIPLVYSHLLSMAHLPLLGKLADAHARRAEEMSKIVAETFAMPEDGDIDLSNI